MPDPTTLSLVNLNDATTALAERLERVLSDVAAHANAGGTAPTAEHFGELQAIGAALRLTGTDPAQPFAEVAEVALSPMEPPTETP